MLIPAFSQFISGFKGKKIMKIGLPLPKLSSKQKWLTFFNGIYSIL